MDAPRNIDLSATFNALVGWVEETARQERAPGLIIGISGTDSILTFLTCAEAFKRLGRQDRVLGVNFEHETRQAAAPDGRIVCARENENWVSRDIFPWLRRQAPQAQLETDVSIPHSDDSKRWGHLFSRAVAEVDPRQSLGSRNYFPVGTRNATEQALGTYSQISKSVSMLPLVQLFKTEVLALCAHLGVPQIAIDKSREIDCDCGRFEVQANHMRELDLYIMHRQGLLSKDYIRENIAPEVLAAVMEFHAEETDANGYRPRTPYLPQRNLIVIAP